MVYDAGMAEVILLVKFVPLRPFSSDGQFSSEKKQFKSPGNRILKANQHSIQLGGCIVWNENNTVFGPKAICTQAVYFLIRRCPVSRACDSNATTWCQRYLPCYLFLVSNSVCFSFMYVSQAAQRAAVVNWLITRFRNRVPGCRNRVTRIPLLGWVLGLDTKYLVKYNQKTLLVLQNKFCDYNKIIFTKFFVAVTNIFCKWIVTKLFCNGHKSFCDCHKSIFAV